MDSVGLDTCLLANQESIQADLNAVVDEYFNWTSSAEVQGQVDYDADSYSSDSDSTCSEHDTSSVGQDDCPLAENCLDLRDSDSDELQTIRNFMSNGCGCQFGPKMQHCSSELSFSDVLESRANCLQLSKEELDLIVLSHLHCHLRRDEVKGRKRKRTACNFYFMGRQICKKTYLFLHAVGRERYSNLCEHYRAFGLTLRVHGNKGRLPKKTCSFEATKQVSTFISNYAEEHALVLPGRVPGFKRTDVRLLPSHMSKASVWRVYSTAIEALSQTPIGYSKFVELWNQLTPHVVIMRPMSDLCFTCQHNNTQIVRSANLPERAKSAVVRAQEEHLFRSSSERSFYRSTVKAVEPTAHLVLTANKGIVPKNNPPCSLKGKMHYSYDYAQQVHYPSNPLQPGPIYFKTPRKCAIFGVCCEAIPRQVNFLVDESVLTGKGANSTISLVHHYFGKFGLGETDAYIHADNCSGQNKNNYFLWYYAWRIIVGLHWNIQYSFLVAGHTKFSPDWCFGLAKQAVRKTFISDLFELARTIDNSTVTGVNVTQLCGLHDGSVIVPTYDWASFLDPFFKKLPGVKGYHHFRFSKDAPGRVYCKRYADSEEVEFDLLKDQTKLPPYTLPPVIKPLGLDLERKNYLYKEIRQFCKPDSANLVAPKP